MGPYFLIVFPILALRKNTQREGEKYIRSWVSVGRRTLVGNL